MPSEIFLLPPFFEFGATFLWTVSGALLGARQGYDIIGIMMLALVSSTGGGLLRDDALGLGAYAVVGMNRAEAAGLSLLGVALVGMVNAVGGGLLRSVLLAREPRLFRPGTLEAAAAAPTRIAMARRCRRTWTSTSCRGDAGTAG